MNGESIEKDVFKVSLPRNIDASNLDELKSQIKTWLVDTSKLYVLDFAQTFQISREGISEFLKLNKLLKENEQFMASINLSHRLQGEFKTQGFLNGFNPVKNIEEAKKLAGFKTQRKAPNANAEFLDVFVVASKTTLEVQAETKVQSNQKPYVRKPGQELKNVAIAGVIHLSSSQFAGSISLCFPKETFLKIYKNMVDEDCTEIDDEIQDAAGELLNIIYGQAKTKLVDELNYDLKPAIPNILVGEQIKIQYKTNSPVMVIPFISDAGEFHIEIVLDSSQSQSAAA